MVKTMLTVASLMISVESAKAVIVPVAVSNFQFSPSSLTINVGDTVRWTWASGFHTTTSVRASLEHWNSPIDQTTRSFDHVFNAPGTFWYICQPHGVDNTINNPNANPPASGMAGSVTVVPGPGVVLVMGAPGIGMMMRRRRTR